MPLFARELIVSFSFPLKATLACLSVATDIRHALSGLRKIAKNILPKARKDATIQTTHIKNSLKVFIIYSLVELVVVALQSTGLQLGLVKRLAPLVPKAHSISAIQRLSMRGKQYSLLGMG